MAITKVTEGVRTLGTGEVATANMATDPTNASNLSSGDVPLAQLGNAPATDLTPLEDDIAILGFKVATNGSLSKYDLVDQTEDIFQDATGIDASSSTNETRNPAKYYSGKSGNTDITAITASGNFTVDSVTSEISVLVVGGGGGGGSRGSGGAGGAGGLVWIPNYATAANTVYAITIGSGGSGGGGTEEPQGAGADGINTVFDTGAETLTITAEGGGGGQVHHGSGGTTGNTGGSGGGGGPNGGGGGATDQATSFGSYSNVGYGNAGGSAPSGSYPGGGGGGAGGTGNDGDEGSGATLAKGGVGKEILIDSEVVFPNHGTNSSNTTSGTRGWFAGGGGGGGWLWSMTNGGVGGGGSATPSIGLANTGGGGGGGTDNSGKAGGSGIVLIRNVESVENMTLVSNSTTAEAVPTKGDFVMTYTNGSGTATINTDIKAYVSRDNGTTYTQFTLADQGDTGGHTILTSHDLDISSQPSGSAMRYKITTHNQSASKETRVQAVSLGWS